MGVVCGGGGEGFTVKMKLMGNGLIPLFVFLIN